MIKLLLLLIRVCKIAFDRSVEEEASINEHLFRMHRSCSLLALVPPHPAAQPVRVSARATGREGEKGGRGEGREGDAF